MKNLSILAAIVAATAPVLAQSSSKTVPATNDTLGGNTSIVEPFGYSAFRSQQVYSSSELATAASTINGMSFRPDYSTSTALTLDNVTVTLSHTSVSPLTMNTTFASNVTGATSTMFSGTMNLPAQADVPFGPLPFVTFVPFTGSFAYDPAQGDLLVDIVANNPLPSTRISYSLDAAQVGGTVEPYGQNGTGVTNLQFRAFGLGGASARTGIVPGGGVEINTEVASWMPDYLGGTVIGLTPAMLDLSPVGATGSSLYVDNHLTVIPFSWQSTFIGKYSPAMINIPSNSAFVDAQIYTQSVMLEPAANTLGIVTTKGLRIAVGDVNRDVTQLITSRDPAATQGAFYFSSGTGGAVTQFLGSFN